MNEKLGGGNIRRHIIFTISVIVAAICILALFGKVTPFEQDRKIQVCEVDRKLFVTIDEKDFNREVYSKNLDDCR